MSNEQHTLDFNDKLYVVKRECHVSYLEFKRAADWDGLGMFPPGEWYHHSHTDSREVGYLRSFNEWVELKPHFIAHQKKESAMKGSEAAHREEDSEKKEYERKVHYVLHECKFIDLDVFKTRHPLDGGLTSV